MEWILDKRTSLLEHIQSKRPIQAPSNAWWVAAAALSPLYQACNIIMKKLQSPSIVISQQRDEVRMLILNLSDGLDVRMAESNATFSSLPPCDYYNEGLFWMPLFSVVDHIADQVS